MSCSSCSWTCQNRSGQLPPRCQETCSSSSDQIFFGFRFFFFYPNLTDTLWWKGRRDGGQGSGAVRFQLEIIGARKPVPVERLVVIGRIELTDCVVDRERGLHATRSRSIGRVSVTIVRWGTGLLAMQWPVPLLLELLLLLSEWPQMRQVILYWGLCARVCIV